jgi:hypothetical protein
MTGEQQPQAASELIMLRDIENGQDLALRCHQLCQRCVYRIPASLGQLNQDAASIIGVILPRHKPSVGESVHPIRHCSRGDESLAQQLPRRKPVRRPRAAECSQHIELPGLQIMGAERIRAEPVQVPREPADPGEDFHWRHVKIRAFSPPGLHDGVDLISGRLEDHTPESRCEES